MFYNNSLFLPQIDNNLLFGCSNYSQVIFIKYDLCGSPFLGSYYELKYY